MISSLTLNSQIKFKCVLPISFPLLQIFCVPRTTSSLSLQAGLADWAWVCSPSKTALPKSILFHHMVSAAAFGGSVHSRVSHPNCMKRGKTLGMWFVISRLLQDLCFVILWPPQELHPCITSMARQCHWLHFKSRNREGNGTCRALFAAKLYFLRPWIFYFDYSEHGDCAVAGG